MEIMYQTSQVLNFRYTIYIRAGSFNCTALRLFHLSHFWPYAQAYFVVHAYKYLIRELLSPVTCSNF